MLAAAKTPHLVEWENVNACAKLNFFNNIDWPFFSCLSYKIYEIFCQALLRYVSLLNNEYLAVTIKLTFEQVRPITFDRSSPDVSSAQTFSS